MRQGVLAEAQRAATPAVQTAMQQAARQAATEAATVALENWRAQVLQGAEMDEDYFNMFDRPFPDSRR